jgi:hypothetical protein
MGAPSGGLPALHSSRRIEAALYLGAAALAATSWYDISQTIDRLEPCEIKEAVERLCAPHGRIVPSHNGTRHWRLQAFLIRRLAASPN